MILDLWVGLLGLLLLCLDFFDEDNTEGGDGSEVFTTMMQVSLSSVVKQKRSKVVVLNIICVMLLSFAMLLKPTAF